MMSGGKPTFKSPKRSFWTQNLPMERVIESVRAKFSFLLALCNKLGEINIHREFIAIVDFDRDVVLHIILETLQLQMQHWWKSLKNNSLACILFENCIRGNVSAVIEKRYGSHDLNLKKLA